MSKLPGRVTTDAATDPGLPPGAGTPRSQVQQASRTVQRLGEGRSHSPRTRPRRIDDAKKKIPPDIRSVDSGYSETSHCPEAVSPDAMPSGPRSFPSVNLGESSQFPSSTGPGSNRPLSSSVDTVSYLQEHLVHKVHKAVGDKKEKEESASMSLPPISSSSTSYSSLPSSSIPSDAPEVTESDIDELRREMPPDMRVDFQDAMVLYSEEDRDRVESFINHFEEIKLYDRVRPKIVLYDEIAVSIGSKFKALEFGIERCTYVFLFITKLFCEDSWSEFQSETCLMEAIHNPSKKWCVVPVFTEPKRSASFRVPPSLNSLKGIQYWTNDKFFRDSVQKLLEEKLFIRKKKEKQLTRDRKEWVTKYRIEKMEEEVREQEENRVRQKREYEAKQRKEYEMAEMKRKQKEAELYHDQQLRQIKSESNMEIQQMMQQFVQRFNVTTANPASVNEPPNIFPRSRSEHDWLQRLLHMSQQQTLLPSNVQGNPANTHGFYLPGNEGAVSPPGPSMYPAYSQQVSLASRDPQGCVTAVQEGQSTQQGYQDTRSQPSSDQGSTGFPVTDQTHGMSKSQSADNAQFFSLPSQSTSGRRMAGAEFRSLPSGYNIHQSGCGREMLSCQNRDLEVDQPPESLPTLGQRVQQGWTTPQSGSTPPVHSAEAVQTFHGVPRQRVPQSWSYPQPGIAPSVHSGEAPQTVQGVPGQRLQQRFYFSQPGGAPVSSAEALQTVQGVPGQACPQPGTAAMYYVHPGPQTTAGQQHQGITQDNTSSPNPNSGKRNPGITSEEAKEVHYHYHYYGKSQDKTEGRKEEQAPINIVGAKVVQIGDNNLVKVLDKGELMEGENAEGMSSSDEESSQTTESVNQRMQTPAESSASQPPSTIFQDNNPSGPNSQVVSPGVQPGTASPVPVQPTRPKEPIPAGSINPTQTEPPAAVSPPVSAVRPAGASMLPNVVNASGAGSTMTAPISSGPMAGITTHIHPGVHTNIPSFNPMSHGRHPVAMVRPMASSLLEQGAPDDNTVQKQVDLTIRQRSGVAGHGGAVSRPGGEVEFEMATESTTVKGKEEEEEDSVLAQTLKKQRELESEID